MFWDRQLCHVFLEEHFQHLDCFRRSVKQTQVSTSSTLRLHRTLTIIQRVCNPICGSEAETFAVLERSLALITAANPYTRVKESLGLQGRICTILACSERCQVIRRRIHHHFPTP